MFRKLLEYSVEKDVPKRHQRRQRHYLFVSEDVYNAKVADGGGNGSDKVSISSQTFTVTKERRYLR